MCLNLLKPAALSWGGGVCVEGWGEVEDRQQEREDAHSSVMIVVVFK